MAADGSATQARVLSEQALKQRESAINRLENVAVVEDEARALDVFRPLFQEREMYFPFTLLTDDVAKTLKKNRKLVGPESVANGPFHVSEIFAALNLADLALVSAHHSSGHLSAAIPTYLSATDPSARDDLSVAAEALARLSAVNTTAASSAWVALASSAGTVARSAAIAACGPILGRLVVLNPPTPSRVPRPLAERAAAIANRIAELHTPNEAGAPREAVDGAGAVGALRHFVEGARGVDGAHGIFAAVAACEHLRQVDRFLALRPQPEARKPALLEARAAIKDWIGTVDACSNELAVRQFVAAELARQRVAAVSELVPRLGAAS